MNTMITDYSEHLQRPILEALYKSAAKHATLSNGLLVALEPDLGLYPHQSLAKPIVKSETADVSHIIPLASIIRPRYKDLSASLAKAEDTESRNAVELMGTIMDSGQDVVLAFDHGEDVVTFIMNSLVVANELRADGHLFRSAVLGSKMLDFLALDLGSFGNFREVAEKLMIDAGVTIEENGLVYARNILARAFEIQYLSIPNTQSTEELRKRHEVMIKEYNQHIRRQIKGGFHQRLIRKPPILLSMAAPGSINKELDVEEYAKFYQSSGMYYVVRTDAQEEDIVEAEVIGWIAPAVTTFTDTAVAFAAVAKMATHPPFLRIDDSPLVLNDEAALRRLGQKQVALLNKAEPSRIHIYDAGGNLPLRKSTAVE